MQQAADECRELQLQLQPCKDGPFLMIEKKLKAMTEITIYTNLWNVEEPDR
jgi:hypothetical protein